MRLDKLLAHTGYGTRKSVQKLLKEGVVTVNGKVAKKGSDKVDPKVDEVVIFDEMVHYQKYYYIMLNKPQGIISATEDAVHETVIDWLGPEFWHIDLFPVGRLDKDTTGLLLITNNGQLAHQLLSPRKKVTKRYQALVSGIVDEEDIQRFEEGLDLGDFITQPAKLTVVDVRQALEQTWIEVEIVEGKFHQVKRMFEAVDKEVLELHRLSMGPLVLDDELLEGDFRLLTPQEMEKLKPYGLIEE